MILLSLILITTIWCLGVTVVTQEGMLFYNIRVYAEKKFKEGKAIYDPLIICEWCLPSLHSFIGYGLAVGIGAVASFSWSLVFMWPLVVMGSSFLTGTLWAIYKLVEVKTRHITNLETLSFFDIKDRKSKFNSSK